MFSTVKSKTAVRQQVKQQAGQQAGKNYLIYFFLALSFVMVMLMMHPIRAQAEVTPELRENMSSFQAVNYQMGTRYLIETNGATLKKIFPGKLSCLNDGDQYFAWFHVSKRRSGSIGWSTYRQYCHTDVWGTSIPSDKKGLLFDYDCFHAGAKTNYGKLDFYAGSNFGYGLPYVSSGKVGTLFYHNLSEKTTNAKLASALTKQNNDKNAGRGTQKKTNQLTVRFSPVIVKDVNHARIERTFYDAWSWKNSGITRDSLAQCKAHYDVPCILTIPTVTVIERWQVAGKLTEDNYYYIGDDLNYKNAKPVTKEKHGIRVTTETEVKPRRELLFTYGDTDYYYSICPDNTNGKAETTNNPETGKNYGFVGFKTYFKINGKRYVLCSESLELEKKNGIYTAKTYSQKSNKSKKLAKSDAAASKKATQTSGKFLALGDDDPPEDMPDDGDDSGNQEEVNANEEAQHVEINNSADSSKSKKKKTTALTWSDLKNSKVKVKFDRRLTSLGKSKAQEKQSRTNNTMTYKRYLEKNNDRVNANIAMDSSSGIPKEATTIYVDYQYIQVNPTPEKLSVTLETYYTTESFHAQTSVNPKVDKAQDLKMNHEVDDVGDSVKVSSKVLASGLATGATWLSYKVKTDEDGSYITKDGSVPDKTVDEDEKEIPDSNDPDAEVGKIEVTEKERDNSNRVNTLDISKTNYVAPKVDPKDPNNYTPIMDTNKLAAKSYIPYVLRKDDDDQKFNETNCNYLYKVQLVFENGSVWKEYSAEDLWTTKPKCGKRKDTSPKIRTYVTNAPFMGKYITDGGNLQIDYNEEDELSYWQKDAIAMTHFIIPAMRSNVTIRAFYTTTVPVKTVVYEQTESGGSFDLNDTKTTLEWYSSGKKVTGNLPEDTDASNDYTVVATQDESNKAMFKPYKYKTVEKKSFSSLDKAKGYFSTAPVNISTSGSSYSLKVGTRPIVLALLKKQEDPAHFFTVVQYVRIWDGSYIKLSDKKVPITGAVSRLDSHRHYCDDEDCTSCTHPDHADPSAWTTKAFVSFPEYVEYDDGTTGQFGSIYKIKYCIYNNNGPNNSRPQKTRSIPVGSIGSNNSAYWLTPKQKNGPAGGDNSLVVYGIYEDALGEYVKFTHKEEIRKDENGEDLKVFPWNWELPPGFVDEDENLCVTKKGTDSVDETFYDTLSSSEFFLQTMGTGGSQYFKAQEAIPSSDYVRVHSEVPRYVTRGYWLEHDLTAVYKVMLKRVKQHASTKTIVTGEDQVKGGSDTISNTFPYYETVSVTNKYLEVTRSAYYYTLGDAEVWDPEFITCWNNTFLPEDVAKNNSNGTGEANAFIKDNNTLAIYGNNGNYKSNARFVSVKAGCNWVLPKLKTNRTIINGGVWNDWEHGEGETPQNNNIVGWRSKSKLQKIAEGMIGYYNVCNNQVEFHDGLGNHTVLTTSSTGLQPGVKEPLEVPDAGYTDVGVFDTANQITSYSTTDQLCKGGIQLIPTINNGHHETCSVAYYRQVQCIPGDYTTDTKIKTKIIDDGNDDVEIFTPVVTYCQINTDVQSTSRGTDKMTATNELLLNPFTNFDQIEGHTTGDSMNNLVLDTEYTLTVSAIGYNSDFDGYGDQNYCRYLDGFLEDHPYMQVMFPFPVCISMANNGAVTGNENVSQGLDTGVQDRYYYANTWISLEVPKVDNELIGQKSGTTSYRFFIPSWATLDGEAQIKFRSIALNGRTNNPELTMLQDTANPDLVTESLKKPGRYNAIDERNYVSQKIYDFTVSGKLYGLQIIDISDYPTWQSVFRQYDQNTQKYLDALSGLSYHAGICNEYGYIGPWGSQMTFPTVKGSHPFMPNVGTLGTGYKVRYKISSVGNYFNPGDKIEIEPQFYYMNSKGEWLHKAQNGDLYWDESSVNRYPVSVYYSETVNGKYKAAVKVGSDEDSYNKKALNLTDASFGVTEDVLQKTAKSYNKSIIDLNKITKQYTFAKTTITSDMRTLVGDTHVSCYKADRNTLAYRDASDPSRANNEYDLNPSVISLITQLEHKINKTADEEFFLASVSKDKILKSVQEWYGEYYLPSDTYVTAKTDDEVYNYIRDGIDGREQCWLDGGSLVVNFRPVLKGEDAYTLKYYNKYFESTDPEDYGVTPGEAAPTEMPSYVSAGCDMFEIENRSTCKTETIASDGLLGSLGLGNRRSIYFDSGDFILYDITNRRSSDPNDPTSPSDPDDPDNPDDGDSSNPNASSAKDSFRGNGSH